MYTMNRRVTYSDVDETGKLSLYGIINYLQDCCTLQSEDYGVGVSYLASNDLGWYLASWNIQIYEYPKLGDDIVVSTWPYLFRGMIGYRNFTIETIDGKRLCDADSIWLMMDLEKQLPARLPQKVEDAFSKMDPPLSLSMSERKLAYLEGHEDVYSFTVNRSHLDTNHHMNNGRYIESTCESLPDDFCCECIKAEYKKPAWRGNSITISRVKTDFGYQTALRLSDTKELLAVVDYIGY